MGWDAAADAMVKKLADEREKTKQGTHIVGDFLATGMQSERPTIGSVRTLYGGSFSTSRPVPKSLRASIGPYATAATTARIPVAQPPPQTWTRHHSLIRTQLPDSRSVGDAVRRPQLPYLDLRAALEQAEERLLAAEGSAVNIVRSARQELQAATCATTKTDAGDITASSGRSWPLSDRGPQRQRQIKCVGTRKWSHDWKQEEANGKVRPAHRKETDAVWADLLQKRRQERRQVEAMLDSVSDERLEWMRKKDYEVVDANVLTEIQWLLSEVRSGKMSKQKLIDELQLNPLPKQWHRMLLSSLQSLQFTEHIDARRHRHTKSIKHQKQLGDKALPKGIGIDIGDTDATINWSVVAEATNASVATRPSLSRAQRRAAGRGTKRGGKSRTDKAGFMAPREAEQRRARKKDGERPSGLVVEDEGLPPN
eukprot:SAG31_NODE_2175_length_6246_cov_6.380380_1_plen_425_part_00